MTFLLVGTLFAYDDEGEDGEVVEGGFSPDDFSPHNRISSVL
jgi:hypothetical protein